MTEDSFKRCVVPFILFLRNILCRWLIAFMYKYCCMRLLNIVPGFLLNISSMLKIFVSIVIFLITTFHIIYHIFRKNGYVLLLFLLRAFLLQKDRPDVMKSLDWLKMKQLSIFHWTAYWWRCYYTNWMCVAFLLD